MERSLGQRRANVRTSMLPHCQTLPEASRLTHPAKVEVQMTDMAWTALLPLPVCAMVFSTCCCLFAVSPSCQTGSDNRAFAHAVPSCPWCSQVILHSLRSSSVWLLQTRYLKSPLPLSISSYFCPITFPQSTC